MRFPTILTLIAALTLCCRCTNLDDASLSGRNTFMRIYEGPISVTATDLLVIDDGYVILGNMHIDDNNDVTILIKTDENGAQLGSTYQFPGGTGNSIKRVAHESFTGYLVLGDQIVVDPNAAQVGNIEKISSRLLKLDADFQVMGTVTIRDKEPESPTHPVLTDFRGKCLTVLDDGSVIIMNTQKPDADTERPYLVALHRDFAVFTNPDQSYSDADTLWINPFLSVGEDNIVGKSIHHNNNDLIWASTILTQQGSFDRSYVSVVRVSGSLAPTNGSTLRNGPEKRFVVNDIQPNKPGIPGFGIVGTFGESDGTRKNIFFTTVNSAGTISAADTLFIDAVSLQTPSTTSIIEDTGEALTSTRDMGFVLAGTVLTTPINGNVIGMGARDIFLVKVNYEGEVEWTKIIGGAGDEVVSNIRETSDGGLLISGTNTLGGYSSIFLIKTDRYGELKN